MHSVASLVEVRVQEVVSRAVASKLPSIRTTMEEPPPEPTPTAEDADSLGEQFDDFVDPRTSRYRSKSEPATSLMDGPGDQQRMNLWILTQKDRRIVG